jgi:DNA-binding MarR family transcriptional regulator
MKKSNDHRNAPWMSPSLLGPCVCSQLRRTARRVSAIYDKELSAVGLTVTQHALLVNIARAGEISRTRLAVQIGMDRTTLTRNLKPLEAAKLVSSNQSSDRRERLLRLTPAGQSKLRRSYSIWENTQQEFTSALGPGTVADLRATLDLAEAATLFYR